MLIEILIYVAVINFSTASSDSGPVPRNKRSDDDVPCDYGWYYYREKCYKIGGRKPFERLRWDAALERCRRYGGDLVSIHSQEKQDFVSFLLLDIKAPIWIGLNISDNQSDYTWSDGSDYNYKNWYGGSPSKVDSFGTKEDCTQVLFSLAENLIGQWNDRDCGVAFAYICEMNADPRKRTPNTLHCSPEEGGGLKFQSSCYHVVREASSWQTAEERCKYNYNGHLVTILDLGVDLFLDHLLADLKDELWIGIKMKNQLQQKWSSGWYVSYDGFGKRKFDFASGTCAARRKRNEWIRIPCTRKLPYICERSKASPPVLKLPEEGSRCPTKFDGWRDLGGEFCYYFEIEKQISFIEALFDCKRRGGDLVSLHSKEESDMLLPFVKYTGEFVFIGLFRLMGTEDEFAWTDGSPLDYENWKTGEPNDENEKCAEALVNDDPFGHGILFSWNDNSCGMKRGYICSVKKISPNATFEKEKGCLSYCIAQPSHLLELVMQSSEAKRLP